MSVSSFLTGVNDYGRVKELGRGFSGLVSGLGHCPRKIAGEWCCGVPRVHSQITGNESFVTIYGSIMNGYPTTRLTPGS